MRRTSESRYIHAASSSKVMALGSRLVAVGRYGREWEGVNDVHVGRVGEQAVGPKDRCGDELVVDPVGVVVDEGR